MLTREEILNSNDMKTEVVQVPEWGGSVIVSTMSGTARDVFELIILNNKSAKIDTLQNARALTVACSVIDEDGALVFAKDDVIALGKKSSAALDRVFEVSQKLSRISDNDIEELAKN